MMQTTKQTKTMSGIAREANAIATIAYRDVMRFLRDPSRLIGTLILPVIFVGVLGASFQSGFGGGTGYNLLVFIFTGVMAQTLFQSTCMGIISLIEDRENDFSQEIFISPISRYSIILGKIFGESLVALVQALAILIFGLIIRVPFTPLNFIGMLIVSLPICLFGGAFGLALLAGFGSQRAANQIVPFLIFPQFFLAGIFSPVKNLPWYLDILSKISPLRYCADLMRHVFYAGRPEYNQVVTAPLLLDIVVMAILFLIFLVIGTIIFVRSEKNK
jgi:ABC-2 type transport system permease protein